MRHRDGHGAIVADSARELVGVRYRPQGRTREDGLDCVGVAAAALALDLQQLPTGYAQRGAGLAEIEAQLSGHGLARSRGCVPKPGDLIIFRPGPAQIHLGICTGGGFVHADAGLRRVVERPWPAPWPIAGIWRAAGPVQSGDS